MSPTDSLTPEPSPEFTTREWHVVSRIFGMVTVYELARWTGADWKRQSGVGDTLVEKLRRLGVIFDNWKFCPMTGVSLESSLASVPVPSEKLLMSDEEVMASLGISRTTLWRLTKRGALKPVCIPGLRALKFSATAVREFVDAGTLPLTPPLPR